MFLSLFKYFLFNTLTITEGFGFALLLREQYRLRMREFPGEEFVSTPSEPVFPETSPLVAEEPVPEPVVASEIPAPMSDTPHHKVDEVDESLLPKGFKVDAILENMRDTQGGHEADSPDFSVVVHESDPYSAAAAFEDDDEYEGTFSPVPPSEPSSLPPIDYDAADDLAGNHGVSSLAVELLGEDFDFQSLAKPLSEIDEVADENRVTEVMEPGPSSGAVPAQELPVAEWIEPAFSREMVDVLLVEPDRPAVMVFTVDSPPMLAKRRKNKPA